jgi:thiol-disulfide isomerase/thioredoxin
LPDVTLRTLDGKAWNLADLKGKTIVINLWATWCVPCRGELPEFQKLYEKLKGRDDVVVASFNVDEDAAKIAPYLKENGLSFPVVLANDLVDAYFPVVFVPQTWFIDSTGKLLWIQEGYGGGANWQKTMTDKLDEVLNTR